MEQEHITECQRITPCVAFYIGKSNIFGVNLNRGMKIVWKIFCAVWWYEEGHCGILVGKQEIQFAGIISSTPGFTDSRWPPSVILFPLCLGQSKIYGGGHSGQSSSISPPGICLPPLLAGKGRAGDNQVTVTGMQIAEPGCIHAQVPRLVVKRDKIWRAAFWMRAHETSPHFDFWGGFRIGSDQFVLRICLPLPCA